MSERKKSAIEEVLVSAQSESEKLQLSEGGLLIGSLHTAIKNLGKDFEYNDPLSPTVSDSADYSKMFETVAESFSQLGKTLLKMRSSYLPFSMINNALEDINAPSTGSSKKISEIIDADTTLESYENTFFRLLGMPSTADIRDKQLITVTQSGTKRPPDPDDKGFALTNKVLEKRSLAISDRLDHPSSSAYDFISAGPSFLRLDQMGFTKIEELGGILIKIKELGSPTLIIGEESSRAANALISFMNANCGVTKEDSKYEKQEVDQLRVVFGVNPPANPTAPKLLRRILDIALVWLEPTLTARYTENLKSHIWREHIAGQEDATMEHLHSASNFWQYSYLLFPPVQDERILTCINEPKKMVAEPFLPESMRTVNGHKLQSTLLEAVIRIRLDIVSGFPQKGAQLNKSGMAIATEGDSRPITANEMGLLEALLIVRLFSALHGFAIDAKKKIEAAKKAQYRSKSSPSTEPAPAGGDNTPAGHSKKLKSEDQLKLESMMLVEESLLLLFGDGSIPEALSYQEGVSRNAGVKSAHLMSAALSILDVPKRWAEQELGKMNEIEGRAADKEAAHATGKLRQKLGLAKGVGALDLLAYLIALFTAEEEILLALLNDRQYGNMVKEYPNGFFDNFPERSSTETGKAVNNIAARAFDAYSLFTFMIRPKKKPRSAPLTKEEFEGPPEPKSETK
jgi:hypothetical protein